VPRKPKRARPKTRQDRARVHEINRSLNEGRNLSAERRGELEAERDRLSPVLTLTRPDLKAWIGRIETARESGGSLSEKTSESERISSDRTPDSPTSQADAARKNLARKLDDAKKAFEPQWRAKALHIGDNLCAVAEQHAKFGYEIWTGRDDWEELPRDGKVVLTTCQLKIWRNEQVSVHPTWREGAWTYFMGLPAVEKLRLRSVFEAQSLTHEQRKQIFEQLKIEERMNEPMPEKYWRKEPQTEQPQIEADEPTKTLDLAPTKAEPEPVLDPVVRASMDLAARADLVLRTDSWLSRLAEHSPDMRTKILASLSDELLRAGFVNGDFCARLYNDSRPRAVSRFSPRQF
jgi:hypothetical protein